MAPPGGQICDYCVLRHKGVEYCLIKYQGRHLVANFCTEGYKSSYRLNSLLCLWQCLESLPSWSSIGVAIEKHVSLTSLKNLQPTNISTGIYSQQRGKVWWELDWTGLFQILTLGRIITSNLTKTLNICENLKKTWTRFWTEIFNANDLKGLPMWLLLLL